MQQQIQMSFDHHGMGLEYIVALTSTHTFWSSLDLQYNVIADPLLHYGKSANAQLPNPQIEWPLYRREYWALTPTMTDLPGP
jgi:exonuclease I